MRRESGAIPIYDIVTAVFGKASRALLLSALILFVLHRAVAPMAENDLFFHLKLGDLILEQHRIPFVNLFSFTWPDHPDPDLSWGFQVAVSLLHRAGGFPAIVLFKALLVAAAAWLVHRTCRVAGAGPIASALATALAVASADQRLCERPHLVTFVGLSALSLLLARAGAEPDAAKRWRLVRWIPLLALVWANFHAGVFLCVLVSALHFAGAALERKPIAPPLRLGALVVISAALTVCTPAGLRLPGYLLWHTGLGASRNIEEFRRADAWNDPWFFALMALCLLCCILRGRRTPLGRVLPVLAVAALAWRSVRFVAEWSLLCAPLAALALSSLGRLTAARTRQAAALLCAALLAVVAVRERRARGFSLQVAPDLDPFRAIAFATENHIRDRMWADLDVGCYLLWEGWPRFPVFEDARLPAYPHEHHRALDGSIGDTAAFQKLLCRFEVTSALVAYPLQNVRAGAFPPESWALVYRGDDALLFARRTEAHAAVIAAHEIPLAPHFTMEDGTRFSALWNPPAAVTLDRCEWDRRLAAALFAVAKPDQALDAQAAALERGCLSGGDAADVRFRLGGRWLHAGFAERAAQEYDRVLAAQPDHVGALVNRGFARLHTRPDAARADFERAQKLDPSREDIRVGLSRLPR